MARLSWIVLESYSLGMGATAAHLAEAEAALVEAIQFYDTSYLSSVGARAFLGAIWIHQGRLEDAQRALSEAQDVSRAHPTALDGPHLLWLEARLAVAEGRRSDAVVAYEATAEESARVEMRWWRARILLDWAEVHVARGEAGDVERARAVLQDARSAFEEMGIEPYAALAHKRLDALESLTP
jgi:hypothetical protein